MKRDSYYSTGRNLSTPEKGFALVSSIMIMTLLLIVSLGVISLSGLESRSSNQDADLARARSNARLALMTALGQLQEFVGPDQRTTASAAILDQNPWTEVAEGVNNPHYIGVWRTDGLKEDEPNTGIIRENEGILTDVRVEENTKPEEQCLAWLVSGKIENPEEEIPGDENKDYLVIARDKNEASGLNDVKVPLVNIDTDKNKQGTYAFWVSDENTKAKINLDKIYEEKNPNLSNPGDGGYTRLYTPTDFNLQDLWENYGDLSQDNIDKIVSTKTIELALSEDQDAPSTYHDITSYSYSLLVNQVDGGLQQDLTAYLENGNQPALGARKEAISGLEPIINDIAYRDKVSPRFSALKSWYDLSDEVSGSLGNRSIDVQLPELVSSRPRLGGVREQQITPVMTEAMVYMRHTFNNRKPVTLFYPRVVLWNPYNVKLKAKGYYVYFHFDKDIQMKIRYPDPSSPNSIKTSTARLNYNFSYNRNRRPVFYLEPTELEPGEALVFTAEPSGSMVAGKAMPMQLDNNFKGNILSASADPADKFCFMAEMQLDGQWGRALPNNVSMNKVSYSYPQEIWWHGSNETQSALLYLDDGGGSPKVTDFASSRYPEVSAMRFDNFSRGNNGRWGPVYTPPTQYTDISNAVQAGPETLVHLGGRLRWMNEDFSNRSFGEALNEPWYAAPLAHSNVRSPNHFRWLRDNMMGQRYTQVSTGTSGARAHLYSYGILSQTRQAPDWIDSQVMPSLAPNGNYRTAVFQSADTANAFSTYPLFELPHKEIPIVSLASLSHAQVSRYWWQPTYPIGNSLAPVNIPIDKNALTAAEEESEKQTTLSTLINNSNNYFTQLNESSGNVLTTDLSYELNHSLWDRFFLSGLPYSQGSGGWSGDKWPEDKPLPNPRMTFNPDNPESGTFAETADFNRSASSLLIDGGFNVNSLSVKAWKALLMSFRDIEMPQRNGDKYETDYVFSRLYVPADGGPSNSVRLFNNAYQKSELWNGYRALTDDQITKLAENIVRENKRRGPYLSLADFVNRRLSSQSNDMKIARSGAIQTAIDHSPINVRLDNKFNQEYNLPSDDTAANDYEYGAEYWGGPTRTPKPQSYTAFVTNRQGPQESSAVTATRSEATGAPGYLMASDVLQQIGSVIRARSDTFVIRAYGDARDSSGRILSKAYCEAVVQRTTIPVNPDEATDGLDPLPPQSGRKDFGRKFKIVSFRWLPNEEI
ncbi:hypothetical protein SAMN02745181_1904 [Rubritalea squalenifaciens DSM 18772]|uniref:Verru_Chthon cassette protein A n=1 Tax=Rubritalea squalenifaciens DSM 18772 TaxID=1123071 RepID=A0A1M6ISN2_9BACT|nr:hypothetical protein [Rubritalea squalenifaciens]SHJ37448.1 hypothetical protein SAMN02745181_1904 [Rubritalea squalenifaciens DSM 18772]